MDHILSSLAMYWPISVVTFLVLGWLTGGAVARVWAPWWQVVAYGLISAFVDRFLHFFVHLDFAAAFLNLPPALFNFVLFTVAGLAAHRFNYVLLMVRQYPWIYRRAGPFGLQQLK